MNKILSTVYALFATFLLSAPAFADLVDPIPVYLDHPVSVVIAGVLLFGAIVASGFAIARKLKGKK